MSALPLKATQRLQAATKVLATVDPKIKQAMIKLFGMQEDTTFGEGGTLGGPKDLDDDYYEAKGAMAPTGTTNVFFNSDTLRAAAKVLDQLDQAAGGEFELGFKVEGGRLYLVIADASEV